ncbi:MAG: FadR family transcriptional regulator [Bacteroidales bacterium]|jgi:GntR family transcriptional repressor for pyruvate dehydrogenase complex|nr:FadR family transcriptional regulator [Bacteroidales bacterium]
MTAAISVEPVKLTKQDEIIAQQIKQFILCGTLKKGDKLPSERKLMEMFNVGRTSVRNAIKKLEFYGYLKTYPQSGTIVVGAGVGAMKNIVSEIIDMDSNDFLSLVEIRTLLEMKAANLAAKRRTKEALREMEQALNAYLKRASEHEDAVDEDFNFHLSIAKACKNKVLVSLLSIITPDMLVHYRKYNLCMANYSRPMAEHKKLYEYIVAQDEVNASLLMKKHLKNIMVFAKKQTQKNGSTK